MLCPKGYETEAVIQERSLNDSATATPLHYQTALRWKFH